MPIENVERFYCRRCGYMTEHAYTIELIKKNGGKCPACSCNRIYRKDYKDVWKDINV